MKEFLAAFLGWVQWINLKKRYNPHTDEYLILFPDMDQELFEASLSNIENFLEKKYSEHAILIVNKDLEIEKGFCNNVYWIKLNKYQIRCLIKYYLLCQFWKNIVVVSLEEPIANKNIKECMDINLEELVKNTFFW